MRILLVEDDGSIGGAVRDHAAADSHAVDWAKTLDDAKELVASMAYDLVLLDLQLPDGNGLDLLSELRRREMETPVIVLTARAQISDRVVGLNAGADDYLVKPFSLEELSARIHAVARRSGQRVQPCIAVGPLRVVPAERTVSSSGRAIDLTAREWAVFDRLLRRRGAVLSKAQIEDALYELGAEVESNTVEVYVSRLRKKLGSDVVSTVRGVGYRIDAA